MGGEMEDEEVDTLIDNGFRAGLMDKTALASFEVKTTADGNEQLKVILLRPDKPAGRSKSGAAAAAASTRPAPAPVEVESSFEAAEEAPAAAPVPARAASPTPLRQRPRINA